ncbi:Alpha/Beta hydrolase protein [Xylaria nigripes]|nr:Alpha/Beta hydrolase protein [Xylaria nigripes]
MTPSSRPVIVLAPGACGTPEAFRYLLPYLDGFEIHPHHNLSCNASDPFTASCANDIAALRRSLLSLLDQQKDVIIIAHSYGGTVAGGAAKDLDKDTRMAQKHTAAVVGLFFIAGTITFEGESLLEAVGGNLPPFMKNDTPSEGFAVVERAMDIFYNDCDPSRKAELDKLTNPHAIQSFLTKTSAPAWADKGFANRRAYVVPAQDCAIPSAVQTAWIERTKVEWDVIDFDSGHFPFISQPKALAVEFLKFATKVAEL